MTATIKQGDHEIGKIYAHKLAFGRRIKGGNLGNTELVDDQAILVSRDESGKSLFVLTLATGITASIQD
jgi:hypothetical protein